MRPVLFLMYDLFTGVRHWEVSSALESHVAQNSRLQNPKVAIIETKRPQIMSHVAYLIV